MIPKISKIKELNENCSKAVLIHDLQQISVLNISEKEKTYLFSKLEKGNECVVFNYPDILFAGKISSGKEGYQQNEEARILGSSLYNVLKTERISKIQIADFCQPSLIYSFIEGFILAGYTFSKYKKEKDDFYPDEILIQESALSANQIAEIQVMTSAVFHTRNLVNEPLSALNALQFSDEIEKLGAEAGFLVEVFNKQKIESLKMGGLLAVNKGSVDPPTFNILEWKPEKPVYSKPVVLVGKGIVFDTGGLSLKPTSKSMDYMKCDMAGGAIVAAVIYAAAKTNLSLHLVGLIPATDNRPDGNAYVPGDVITMYDGTTVEIKNTDAEGRLILADALSYAKKYDPLLVVDLATLTGSAEIIAGNKAIVGMGNSPEHLEVLKQSGEEVYERIIEVPLWEEYAKPLKSEIADLNNLGVREAQSTIAGKFLEHFTNYPWIHLDIAGVSFFFEKDAYRPLGGTGIGVRLLYNFLKKLN